MNYPHVHIENRRLQGVLAALRELGKTTIPASVLLKMIKTQKTIIQHLEAVQETNNALIAKYGEVDEASGQAHVTPEMDTWNEFQREAVVLTMVEFDVGEPFMLYERKDENDEIVIGWSDPVKTPLDLTANLIVDAGDIIVIDLLEPEAEEAQVVGGIVRGPGLE